MASVIQWLQSHLNLKVQSLHVACVAWTLKKCQQLRIGFSKNSVIFGDSDTCAALKVKSPAQLSMLHPFPFKQSKLGEYGLINLRSPISFL